MFHPVSSQVMSPLDMPNRGSAGGAPQNRAISGGNASVPGSDDVANAGKPMVQVSAGGGSGCLMCLGLKSGMIPLEKLEQIKAESFAKIMTHEQAHASAAGAFGGPIHIDYDSNGIAIGGHVPIMVPGLDRMNPEESMKAFEQILAAALAPSDPSGQDMSVAAMAQSRMGQAKVMMDQKEQMMAKMGMTPPNGQAGGGFQNSGQNPGQSQNQRFPFPGMGLSTQA